MQKMILALLIVVSLAALGAWSPWLTQGSAKTRAIQSFNRSWETVVDGCGTNCAGCGAVTSRRVPFGILVTIEYACGLIPQDRPEYHDRANAFVSTLGTVHSLPMP
jgi:hypothetical protein